MSRRNYKKIRIQGIEGYYYIYDNNLIYNVKKPIPQKY